MIVQINMISGQSHLVEWEDYGTLSAVESVWSFMFDEYQMALKDSEVEAGSPWLVMLSAGSYSAKKNKLIDLKEIAINVNHVESIKQVL